MKNFFVKMVIIWIVIAAAFPVFGGIRADDLKAVKGVLDLKQWDFERQGTVNLNGEWELYDNRLLEPKALEGEKPDRYFNMPGSLKKELNGRITGYMTLRLRIYAQDNVVYGLKISNFLSASRIWVNGILQSESGKIGKNFQDEKAIYLPSYSYFTSESGMVDIVIEASNFRDIFPVIKAIEFGTKVQIMNRYLLAAMMDLIIIGGLLVIELLFLSLYIKQKDNKSFLYFAVLCVFIQLRCLFLNERVIIQFYPHMPYELLSKTAALTFYLYIPVYVLFLKEQFSNLSKRLMIISNVFGVGFGLICLVTSNIFYDRLAFLGEAALVIIVIMIFRFLIKKVRLKEKNAGTSLIALSILIATVFNDILVNNGLSYGKYLTQVGTFIFAILETYILSVKYSDEINKTQELEAKNRIIYEKSIRDSLTGLFNRNYIEKVLDDLMTHYLNKQHRFSVIMFDIDYFKSINDHYGHLFGDEVLVKVAELIKENLRYMDFAGRYGGEEFIILLKNTNTQKAFEIAERIRAAIEHFEWNHELKITISGGVYENNSANKLEAVENADKLLYQAKKRGRNQICS